MSTYSMAQMETLTGISAHTLRIWERRYSFLNPSRTESNIRYYSDEELVKLLNITVLLRNGYKISKIDAMPNGEMIELITNILSNVSEDIEDKISALTLSMLEMDEDKFNKVFQRKAMRKGLQATIIELIYPFLHQIGVLWGTSKIIPAQEHFISNLIRQKIIAAIDALPSPASDAPGICLFLLDGEDHEIGLLLAAYIARDLGWRVFYLGQNVPLENISDAAAISKSAALLSMFVIHSTERTEKLVEGVLESTKIPFLVSGSSANFENLTHHKNLIHIKSPDELASYLKKKP
jgi:MerR family transcriptional regulator, light-induced transcriptional regulator